MVTYDLGVLGEFEHFLVATRDNPHPSSESIDYVGECSENLQLNYGHTKVAVLLCSWVQARTQGAQAFMKKDEFGFRLVLRE
jgi:hypothetical protein